MTGWDWRGRDIQTLDQVQRGDSDERETVGV